MSHELSEKVARWSNRTLDLCLAVSVFLVPLIFVPNAIDILELPKQTIVLAIAAVALAAFAGKVWAERHFSLPRSWLHFAVALFLIGSVAASFFSQDRTLSLLGGMGQTAWAAVTLLALGVLYVVAVLRLRTPEALYRMVFVFLMSSLLAGLYAIVQMTGWHVLPNILIQSKIFTSIGTVYALALYLVVPIVLAFLLIFSPSRASSHFLSRTPWVAMVERLLIWVTLLVGLAVLVLVDFWPAWIALALGMAMILVNRILAVRHFHPSFLFPGILLAASLLLFFFHSPVRLSLPAGVTPSVSASWNIARQSLTAHPFFGSGPDTWAYDYALDRSPAVNGSPFWNIRFDEGFSSFLTLLATFGIVGTGLWLGLIVCTLVNSLLYLRRQGKHDEGWQAHAMLFSAWCVVVFITFVYHFNLPFLFVFWLLLAGLARITARDSVAWDGRHKTNAAPVFASLSFISIIGAIAVVWLVGQRLAADVVFASALNHYRAGQSIEQVIEKVAWVHALNPYQPLYTRNLAQAHLVSALTLLQKQKNGESASLIQTEVAQAIDIAKQATVQAPADVENWSNLALVYENVASFTRGADEFAIQNYDEAIKREPSNPALWDSIGKLFVLRVEAYRTLLNAKDGKIVADAKKNITENLKQAELHLKQAIVLKPDYLPAHYHLAVVYERQGVLPQSVAELEQVLRLNPKDVGVAFELAILYYRNNDKNRSLDLFEQMVRLDPTNANARWYLSFIYEERGRLDEAIAQIEEIHKQFPDNATVQQRLTALKQERDANKKPSAQPLPEPLKDQVQVPGDQSLIKK